MSQPATAAIVVACIFAGLGATYFGYRLYRRIYYRTHGAQYDEAFPPVRQPFAAAAGYGTSPVSSPSGGLGTPTGLPLYTPGAAGGGLTGSNSNRNSFIFGGGASQLMSPSTGVYTPGGASTVLGSPGGISSGAGGGMMHKASSEYLSGMLSKKPSYEEKFGLTASGSGSGSGTGSPNESPNALGYRDGSTPGTPPPPPPPPKHGFASAPQSPSTASLRTAPLTAQHTGGMASIDMGSISEFGSVTGSGSGSGAGAGASRSVNGSTSSTNALRKSYAPSSHMRSGSSGQLSAQAALPPRRESYLPHNPANRESIMIVPPQPLGFGTPASMAMGTDQRTLAFSRQSGIGLDDSFSAHFNWVQQNGDQAQAQAQGEEATPLSPGSSMANVNEADRLRYLREGPAPFGSRPSSPGVPSVRSGRSGAGAFSESTGAATLPRRPSKAADARS